MNLLLDTHALIWWLDDDKALSSAARQAIREPRNIIFASAVSAWEIEIKKALGKLDAPEDLEEAFAVNRFRPLDITIQHAVTAGRLPRHHNDPFDRMLIAQAQLEGLRLVSQDPRFKDYRVDLLWD